MRSSPDASAVASGVVTFTGYADPSPARDVHGETRTAFDRLTSLGTSAQPRRESTDESQPKSGAHRPNTAIAVMQDTGFKGDGNVIVAQARTGISDLDIDPSPDIA